jgi:Schlafen, AlbA_2
MENFFGKPLDQIDDDDILSLIDFPEGQLFEIKSDLAAEKNNKDPWHKSPDSGKPRKGPSDYAKQNIFKEIIAFANSEGGWLVLGLTETSDHPKRVKGMAPLPDCHELAERFKRAAYDWIDPPLPSLQCRGIVMEDTTGKGVIVFRVPRSLAAPHRLYKRDRTQEAYKRVSDESKPMRMREIQDLTLDIVRGQERIDKEFNNARDRCLQLRPHKRVTNGVVGFNGLIGFYVVMIPYPGPVVIDRPYLKDELFKRKWVFDLLFHNERRISKHTIDSGQHYSIETLRPSLRGGRKIWSGIRNLSMQQQTRNEDFLITLDIFESGIVQLSVIITYNY